MKGNEISSSMLPNSRSVTIFAVVGLSLAIPIENILDIGDRLIVKYEFHAPLRAKPSNALPRFGMGQQLPVRVCFAAANFSYLCFGQMRVVHMLDVVEQRAGGGILLAFRQLFDLAQGLLK